MGKRVQCPYCGMIDKMHINEAQYSKGKPERIERFVCSRCGNAFWKAAGEEKK